MRSLTLHLKLLITALVGLGVLITCLPNFVLRIPVTEHKLTTCGTLMPK